jgi:hypothetical protein
MFNIYDDGILSDRWGLPGFNDLFSFRDIRKEAIRYFVPYDCAQFFLKIYILQQAK